MSRNDNVVEVMNGDPPLLETVCSASAAYMLDALPSIVQLSSQEAFERLKQHFLTAFRAFADAHEGWGFSEPSRK